MHIVISFKTTLREYISILPFQCNNTSICLRFKAEYIKNHSRSLLRRLTMGFSTLFVGMVAVFLLVEVEFSRSSETRRQVATTTSLADCQNQEMLDCVWIGTKQTGNKATCNHLCNNNKPGCQTNCSCTCQKINCKPREKTGTGFLRLVVQCIADVKRNGRLTAQNRNKCSCKMRQCSEEIQCSASRSVL